MAIIINSSQLKGLQEAVIAASRRSGKTMATLAALEGLINDYAQARDHGLWREWTKDGPYGDQGTSDLLLRLVDEEIDNRLPNKFKLVGED